LLLGQKEYAGGENPLAFFPLELWLDLFKRLLLLDLERHVLYDHTRKHAINKTAHQTLLKD
jgi:hypothetical protein